MMLPSSKKKPMPPSEPPSWYRADAGKVEGEIIRKETKRFTPFSYLCGIAALS